MNNEKYNTENFLVPNTYLKESVITKFEEVNGELVLPIPQSFLDTLGWKEGDEVEVNVQTDIHGNKYLEITKA